MIARSCLLALALAVHASAATVGEYRAFAVQQAKEHVPPSLKNPRSAEFDDSAVKAIPLVGWGEGKGVWMRVDGVVRATNAFNAVVPSRWSAYVTEIDGSLELGILTVGENVVHVGTASKQAVLELERLAMERKEQADADAQASLAKAAAAKERDRAAMRGEADRLRAELKSKQDSRAAALELRRVDAIRLQGRRDGHAAVSAMGKARGRLTDADAKKRADAAAAKAGIPQGDVAAYVSGYLSGAALAKAGQPLTN